MVPVELTLVQKQIPEGYVAIPVSTDQLEVPLRVCLLVKQEPDPVAGHLVVIRDTLDAKVYLGAVVDHGGQVRDWVEVWVQDLAGLEQVVPGGADVLCNEVLDRRWKEHAQSLALLDPSAMIQTGWESVHPAPTLLDLDKCQPVHPVDGESGGPWSLCQDEQVLEHKNLPGYKGSLSRYLYQLAWGNESPFVLVVGGDTAVDDVRPVDELFSGQEKLIPLNPGGGLMMIRRYSPMGLESYLDVLSGNRWEGVSHGRGVIELGFKSGETVGDQDDQSMQEGRLFIGQHGRWGRLVETYHLKLRLLSELVRLASGLIENTQRPIFNLSPASFQIRLGEPGWAMPFLWSACSSLVNPGDAIALEVPTSDAEYFMPGRTVELSIYGPESAGQSVQGVGTVRVRQVLEPDGGNVIVEGTFTTQERIDPAPYDLAWFRLNFKSGRVDLYSHLETESAMAAGEWRFRTVGQRLGDAVVDDLQAAAGVTIPDTRFEMVPLLSSPVDLYSMGVLAVRSLFVDDQTKLSVALDEVLSLARQVAADHDPSDDLGSRIRAVFDQDSRWVESLGPQRLVHEELSAQEAFDLIPGQLWWDTLAMVVQMFPGIGPDSRCRDYGDAPPGGIHRVFDHTIGELDRLVRQTRSLIVIDWRFNREVHAIIRRHLTGITEEASDTA